MNDCNRWMCGRTARAGLFFSMMAWLVAASSTLAHAESSISVRPIQFKKGASSATVSASIKGDQTVDYTLRAREGQAMTVKLATKHGALYFNVLPPGSNDEAVFVGSTSGNEWKGELKATGEYRIRIYLMRSAARRGETANFKLTVGVDGAPGHEGSRDKSGDAKVPGTKFHATGPVPCSFGDGKAASRLCEFGVIRKGSGRASVYITLPDGQKRVLEFDGAKVYSNGGQKVEARKKEYDWEVVVSGTEHFRIPEAVVSGD